MMIIVIQCVFNKVQAEQHKCYLLQPAQEQEYNTKQYKYPKTEYCKQI